jgi:aminopeptidase N
MITVYLERKYLLGEEFYFTIVYSGPVNAYAETSSSEGLILFTYHGETVMSNLSQPYDARDFWPCKDVVGDKADSLDVLLTVDTALVATSNGLLLSDVDNGNGTHTTHWSHRYPLPSYSVCLAISNYIQQTDYYVYSPTDSIPIDNYFYPSQYDTAVVWYSVMPGAMAVLADIFIEYPFINEKYGNTQVIFGSMEHQTNTFMSSLYGSYESILPILIHELAHSWWGNLVTCRDWSNIWLNEGFASYTEALYFEVVEGEDYFHAYMKDIEYFDGGTLYVYNVGDPWEIFSWRSYDKGAWVLHMLRHVVGDDAFFSGMINYANTYAYGSAITEEFQAIMEAHSGMNLDYFIQGWLHGEYYPIYRYSYLIEEDLSGGWNLYLHIRQKQNTDPQVFSMPIDITISTSAGEESVVVFNDRRGQNFILHTDDEPISISFDPDEWILKKSLWESYDFHIANETLAPAAQAEPYEDLVLVKGGSGNHICEIISGQMPDGWTLYPSGLISGITSESGSFTFMIRATDLEFINNLDSMEYTIELGIPDNRPGDANADGEVNVGDAVHIINYVFKQGSPPLFPNWADVNADCQVNVGDAVYLITYIFKEGSAPKPGCVE